MRDSSESKNFKSDSYTILECDKKSRYAVLKNDATGDIIIADIVDFKVLYKLNTENYEVLFVRPRSVVLNVPKTEFLISYKNMARIIFLKEYNKCAEAGIIVFENGTLSVFNYIEESMVRITNLDKAVLQMFYTFELEGDELFSGYHVVLRYFNKDKKFQELRIEVLNKSEFRAFGGIVVQNLMEIEHGSFWYCFERLGININESVIREIDIMKIPSLRGTKVDTCELKKGLTSFKVAKHYNFLK